jgi:hypothetical protein
MSKIKNLTATISHWKDEEKLTSIVSNFYVFREAQSTGSADHHNLTTWEWGNNIILIKEVGIYPNLETSKN